MRFVFYYVFLRWFIRILFCAQQDPIERLYVSIEGDFSNLLDAANEGVDKTKDKLGELDKEGQKAGGGIKKGAALAGAAFGLAATAASALLNVVINIATSAVQMFQNLTSQAIQLAGNFEQVQLTFTNIFGNRAEANAFLKGLQSEAAKLGVSFNEASQFAKSLFPDTTGVEQFNKLLRVAAVGAADAGLSLNELIFAFNEAVSGDFVSIRDRLDIPKDVIEKIKAAPSIVEGLTTELDKLFTKRGVNDLEAAGSTLEGLQRRIRGFTEELILVAGLEILGPLRDGFQKFFDLLQSNRPALEEIAGGIGEIVGIVVDFASQNIFGNFDIKGPIESVKTFIEWIERTIRGLLAAAEQVKAFLAAFEPVGALIVNIAKVALAPLLNGLSQLWELFSRLDEAMVTAAQGLAIVTATIEGLKVSAMGAWDVVKNLAVAVFALATGNIDLLKDSLNGANEGIAEVMSGADAFKASMLESAKSIDAMINPAKEATEEVKKLGDQLEETGEKAAEPLLDQSKLDSYTDQLVEATERRDEQLAKLEQDHGQKMQQIIKDANDKAIDIEEKYNDDLAKLTKETETKRLDIIEDTRRELADLAQATDQELKTKRKQFNTDERRETEDHLKEMRRLQEDHLMSLEDAVRDRDAGAIVDLQRRFQTESARKEEDFQQGQSRDKSDFSDELNQIRENEAQRRQEILGKQAEQLADLQQHEQDKRLELDMRRQEENEKLQQNLQDQLLREQENYAQRKQALDEALQQQLEAIAEGLAKEKDITEEGARQILEKFDEYFGIGGDIDQLMADFARRRKIRADITVAFQSTGATEPAPEPTTQERLGAGLATKPGGKRLGGIQEFAAGGTLIADKPTLALFGEAGPEVVQFTPMSQLSSPGSREPGRMIVEMTGSAPPGIGASERDQIAAVLLSALQETGVLG